ncbi:(2Fe-2S)-binding protein [Planotetraspora phitsanulokensis]|uniref:(2Fe-2S)-binding protein n=2 Tax=Planotetraspora phitsanulokensis TaxID=575192 RepID=A0A8J3UAV1_9ACTN|nr:(2Fe-2S)-binding protein [Planotetraspora phitsanulokensis]
MTAIVRGSGGNPANAADEDVCLALGSMGSSESTISSAVRTETTFTVNGRSVRVELDPRESLLDVLRERLGLTGTKKGCDHGQCGACTVHLDGRRIVSCLTPAVQVNGQAVTTIEGVADPDGTLHPLQEAFIDNDALQCGYCTPGQVMSGLACIAEGHAGSDDEIREYLSGNLCRCGAYAGILAAVRETARRPNSPSSEG